MTFTSVLLADPQYEASAHNQGDIQMNITNQGRFGVIDGVFARDPFTGEQIIGMTYPRDVGFHYITGDIAIGAVRGNDTLVTTWKEFAPDAGPFGGFTTKSIDESSRFFSEGAFSLFDLTCTYFDTLTDPTFVPPNPSTKRPHRPLGIRIKQRSMAWSGANLDNLILINYEIANIGEKDLTSMFVQVSLNTRTRDPGVDSIFGMGGQTGFLRTWQIDSNCPFSDIVNTAYSMDNNGHVRAPLDIWAERSPLAAMGVRILGVPADTFLLNYNWYWPIGGGGPNSWGPSQFGGRFIGGPISDVEEYHVMSHPEFDYDQIYAATDLTALGWLPPIVTQQFINASALASSISNQASQSFGPFDLPMREVKSFTIAIIGGDSVHVNPTDWLDLFPYPHDNPLPYYNSLDFSRLAENARWADWVYDNPGG